MVDIPNNLSLCTLFCVCDAGGVLNFMEKRQEIQVSEECVWDVSWSPDGQYLIVSGGDKMVHLYAFYEATGKLEQVACLEDGHERTIRRIAWSPDQHFIASVSFDSVCLVWERSTSDPLLFQAVASLEGHQNEIKGVSWNGDGTILATCGRDKMIFLWELVGRNDFDVLSVLEGHTQDVKAVHWNVSDERLYSCSYDGSVKVWEDEGVDFFQAKSLTPFQTTPSSISTLSTKTETVQDTHRTVWDIAFAKQGLYLLAVGDEGLITLFTRTDFSSLDFQATQQFSLSSTPLFTPDRLAFPIFSIVPLPLLSHSESHSPEELFVCADGLNNLSILQLSSDTMSSNSRSSVTPLSLIYQQSQAHQEDVNCVSARSVQLPTSYNTSMNPDSERNTDSNEEGDDNNEDVDSHERAWWIVSGSDDGWIKLWKAQF